MQVHLKPSKLFLVTGLLLIAGSLMSIFCANMPAYLQILLSLLLFLYSGLVLWTDILLRSQRAVVGLLYCDDNTWLLKERSHDALPAILEGSSVITSYFCLLRFRLLDSRKKRSCLVFWDAVPKNRYRQLLSHLGSMKVH